jgi:hypothetical protein
MNTTADRQRQRVESAELTNMTPMCAEVVAIEFAQQCGHHSVDLVE